MAKRVQIVTAELKKQHSMMKHKTEYPAADRTECQAS